MRIVAVTLIALLAAPAGTVAEDLPAGTPPPGFLRAAAIREAIRLGQTAAAATAQSDAWSVIRNLPAGSRLSLTLIDGAEVTGTVVEVQPDAVAMKDTKTTARTLTATARTDGALVFRAVNVTAASVGELATRYKTTGVPDAAAVRQVAGRLGVGKKVDLRMTNSARVRARIRAIDADRLTFEHGLPAKVDSVPYADVRELRPAGLHWAAKAGIAAGAVYGGLAAAVGLCYASGSCAS